MEKRNFKTLTIGSKIFFAHTDEHNYHACTVDEINQGNFKFHYSKEHTDGYKNTYTINNEFTCFFENDSAEGYLFSRDYCKNPSMYSKPQDQKRRGYVFRTEGEARRYCKAQLFKRFLVIKEEADRAMKRLLNFRIEHYEELNTKYIDSEIKRLEQIEI